MKESYYFPHDYHARADEKIIPMLAKHGVAGYGVYWMLVEKIYEAGGRLAADWQMLSYDLRVASELVEGVATGFGLFFISDGKLGSISIDRRICEREQRSKKASESGKMGALARIQASNRLAEAKQPLGESQAGKERKGKEIKEKETTTTTCPQADSAPETKPTKRFQKPTVSEIVSYCLERKNSVEAQKFFDYYESKGWLVGKSPMRNWKAAVRTWEQNGLSNGGYQNGASRIVGEAKPIPNKYDC